MEGDLRLGDGLKTYGSCLGPLGLQHAAKCLLPEQQRGPEEGLRGAVGVWTLETHKELSDRNNNTNKPGFCRLVMVCSRCLVHDRTRRKWGNLLAFLRHFMGHFGWCFSVPLGILRVYRVQRGWPLNDSATKMAAPIKLIIVFLYLYHIGQINVDFKCSYTLDYIAT